MRTYRAASGQPKMWSDPPNDELNYALKVGKNSHSKNNVNKVALMTSHFEMTINEQKDTYLVGSINYLHNRRDRLIT